LIKITPYFDFAINYGRERIRFKLHPIPGNGIYVFYQCECERGGTGSFNIELSDQLPQEIIEEMRMHVNLNHLKGEEHGFQKGWF
jgi:hypothetical protein